VSNDYFLLIPRREFEYFVAVAVVVGCLKPEDKINEFNVWCHKNNIYKTFCRLRRQRRRRGGERIRRYEYL
jgi:hypothetical protein